MPVPSPLNPAAGYVLHKASRTYTAGPGYSGPTCDRAGVTPGRVYATLPEAEADRVRLNAKNGVGFVVTPYRPAPTAFPAAPYAARPRRRLSLLNSPKPTQPLKRYQLFAIPATGPLGGRHDVAVQADTAEALFAAYRATAPAGPARFEVLDIDRRIWYKNGGEPSAIIEHGDEAEATVTAAEYRALGFHADALHGAGRGGRIYGVLVSC